jgi:hypothetical protein
MLGKVKIAQIAARAELHLGQTSVGCILQEKPAPKPAAARRKPRLTSMAM